MTSSPKLIVVSGPNGSGKTTVALRYAALHNLPYFSADAIAADLNPESTAFVQMMAGRKFLESVNEYIRLKKSCIIESTMAGKTLANTIERAKEEGFDTTVIFVFLVSPDACIARVNERVRKGGHAVPEEDVRRRFHRSIGNFWNIYRHFADTWVLLYNGNRQLQDVAVGSFDQVIVRDEFMYESFRNLLSADRDG